MHPVEMHIFPIFFVTLILIAFDFAGDGGTINTGEEEEDGGISSSAASGAAAASVAAAPRSSSSLSLIAENVGTARAGAAKA